MKRTAEFVLGLIGGIFGIITTLISFVGAGFVPLASKNVEKTVTLVMATNFIGIALSITGLVFACRVNKNSNVSGIMMIIAGVGVFLCNFFNVIPLILFLIAGIMCLARKVETQNEQIA